MLSFEICEQWWTWNWNNKGNMLDCPRFSFVRSCFVLIFLCSRFICGAIFVPLRIFAFDLVCLNLPPRLFFYYLFSVRLSDPSPRLSRHPFHMPYFSHPSSCHLSIAREQTALSYNANKCHVYIAFWRQPKLTAWNVAGAKNKNRSTLYAYFLFCFVLFFVVVDDTHLSR